MFDKVINSLLLFVKEFIKEKWKMNLSIALQEDGVVEEGDKENFCLYKWVSC